MNKIETKKGVIKILSKFNKNDIYDKSLLK
jgi:hypothetical protein